MGAIYLVFCRKVSHVCTWYTMNNYVMRGVMKVRHKPLFQSARICQFKCQEVVARCELLTHISYYAFFGGVYLDLNGRFRGECNTRCTTSGFFFREQAHA